ncbi:LOW QUALITY PROTEIN: tRNA (adenine(58)-N(1))-methyltransferase non-catalytic subunit TRM6-like [Dermacentor silvarum]|uniref:LOW QUALITY PROTEIN: tRNA (adenine(58)-N(1))-methyltransferase non-catalytic subunit TRM6-like n=1 Tax=Dermacentor silvarum TaxID=543639 RepID=UPI00189ACEFB|nr:LOW QUALITY PROTEIN: tRNA (adenine(58)-N(1))-methyltransferase non-catalytic subunit TRM6-like [Dermacentor silvarum]
MNTIKEGSYVVVRGSNNTRLVQVDSKKPVFFGKRKFSIQTAIGEAFGSVFEIDNRDLRKISAEEYRKICSECEVPGDDAPTSGQDNRNLLDDGKSQKLTREDIETFKADGTSGERIVKTLVENSTTFKEKTEYAQRKYLKKKQDKYLQHVMLGRPTARLLVEMYYSQNPLKIGNMRVDSLAQMLTCCNVRSGGRYIVFDSWVGLLTAAVLERLGQQGSVVQVYAGQGPDSSYRQAVYALNLEEEFLRSTVLELPYAKACSLLTDANSETPEGKPESENQSAEMEDVSEMNSLSNNDSVATADDSQPSKEPASAKDSKDLERAARKQRRLLEQQKAIDLLKTKSLDGLLVASKHHPTSIVLSLLEFIAPSRPFAIFCSFQEPLVDCYTQLKNSGSAVFLKLTESWLRSHQVLPNRTHPSINMSGGGGYVLTGIKVADVA